MKNVQPVGSRLRLGTMQRLNETRQRLSTFIPSSYCCDFVFELPTEKVSYVFLCKNNLSGINCISPAAARAHWLRMIGYVIVC